MSTKTDRAWRVKHHIMPIKIAVRQRDGSILHQRVEADVRIDKRNSKRQKERN